MDENQKNMMRSQKFKIMLEFAEKYRSNNFEHLMKHQSKINQKTIKNQSNMEQINPCEGPTTNEYLQTIVRNGLITQMEHHQTCAIWCSGAIREVGWSRIRNSNADKNVAA